MIGIIFILFHFLHAEGTDPYPRNRAIDVLHYTFRIAVNDTTNIITGRADVTVRFHQAVNEFQLNLINRDADGLGMEVFDVTLSGKPVHFIHRENKISLSAPNIHANDTLTFSISYKGEPRDGLVIGKNKFGDRTFFGDNWPDRGRYWLPAVDHPSDKAKVDFIVTAPAHYQVIATGQLLSAKELKNGFKEHHWHEKADVAVKVITIGIARFSIQQSGAIKNIPISTWVFPQNEQAGFQDFAVAPSVFEFMQNYIGPYPYEKLAHVQSKTRFGGLENVSNIFYFENSVNGKREREGLIAHETAHQWFGNSVTEDDWHHVWLSEGFATYFAALYLGATYGDERLAKEMANDRTEVIKFYQKQKSPIIDTTITDINSVLSTNTYQKAAWVLHMLRTELGPDCFQRGIQTFYSKYRDGNASTDDFRDTMESTCDRDLDSFFSSWLEQAGHPRLGAQWTYNRKAGGVKIMIETSNFLVPNGTSIEIGLEKAPGSMKIVKYPLQSGRGPLVVVPAERKPARIILDPRTILLFEGGIQEKP